MNFFSSKLNTLLSLLSLLFIYYVSLEFVNFLLSADWEVVKVNRRLLLLGRLPLEDTWRAWPIFWVICFALFSSIGAWGSPKKIELALMFLAIILPSLIFLTIPNLHLFFISFPIRWCFMNWGSLVDFRYKLIDFILQLFKFFTLKWFLIFLKLSFEEFIIHP